MGALGIRLTNNVLSTAQQVYLRQGGGAKPIVDKDGGDIISAGQAKRTSLPSSSASTATTIAAPPARDSRGERYLLSCKEHVVQETLCVPCTKF